MNGKRIPRGVIYGGAGLLGVAAIVGAMALFEDQDGNIKEFGIDNPESSCFSPEEGHRFNNRFASPENKFSVALRTLESMGQDSPAAQGAMDAMNTGRPFCFTNPGSQSEVSGIVKGGTFKPFWVVDGNRTAEWLGAHFAAAQISGFEDKFTRRTNEYITGDAVLWERLRHAVPQTYNIYAHYVMAQQEYSYNPFDTDVWEGFINTSGNISEITIFQTAIEGGADPRTAWSDTLKAYLVNPERLNERDKVFLNWYEDEVDEQSTLISYDVTCFDNGPAPDINTTLPEKVDFDDVWNWSVRSDADSECDRLISAEEQRVEEAKNDARKKAESLWSDVNDLDIALGRLPEGAENRAAMESELASKKSRAESLQRSISSMHPERQSFSDSVKVHHEPSEVVHSLDFNPETLWDYVHAITGDDQMMAIEDAFAIANDPRNIALYSEEATRLYQKAQENARRYADNYNPYNGTLSRGVGLR